jgi:hypothetical protein
MSCGNNTTHRLDQPVAMREQARPYIAISMHTLSREFVQAFGWSTPEHTRDTYSLEGAQNMTACQCAIGVEKVDGSCPPPPCPAGFAKDVSEDDTCSPCAPGLYSSAAGSAVGTPPRCEHVCAHPGTVHV